jgi:hypothetical protein
MKGAQVVLTKVDNGWVVSIVRRPGEDFSGSTYIAHTLGGACSMLMAELETCQEGSDAGTQWEK